MSVLAQTIAGKFDGADLCFMLAFFAGLFAVLIDCFVPEKARASQILIRLAVTLVALAFWIS